MSDPVRDLEYARNAVTLRFDLYGREHVGMAFRGAGVWGRTGCAAAGIYFLVSGHGQGLSLWLGNLRVGMRRAASSGGQYQLPGVSAVVSRPEFEALRQFLEGWELEGCELEARQVDIAQLQARISPDSRRGLTN